MPTPTDKWEQKEIQEIDAAWNNDIERSPADKLRRYLKITFPLRDLRVQKVIRFDNAGPGWDKTPCFAYPWGYSNIMQNCPAIEESELDFITRVMGTYIHIDQETGVSKYCSNRGNYGRYDVTEQYIVAGQSPLFCQYIQEWTDPQEISPIQIPSSTTISDAMRWWFLATLCEETTDEAPYLSVSEIKERLEDQQRSNKIENCPLWEMIVESGDRAMHPDSHTGKEAFYTLGYCSGHCFGEVHSYVVDPTYRGAFLATEKETGIDAHAILACIGREWIQQCEKQHKNFGTGIEAYSSLLAVLDGDERTFIPQNRLKDTLRDLLVQEEIITKISSGDYILSKGVWINTIQNRLEDLQRECNLEGAQWSQSSILLQQPQREPIQLNKIIEHRKEKELEIIPAEETYTAVPEPGSDNKNSSKEMREIQRSLLEAFYLSSHEQSLDAHYLSRLESHLREIFAEFKIDCVIDHENFDTKGPRVIRANIKPGNGVTIDSIQRRSTDIANRLYSASELFNFKNNDEVPTDVYIENVSAKGMVGIHIPRKDFSKVDIRGLLETLPGKSHLEFPLGINITGDARHSDLIDMPHILIAGHTGSGKSVFLNSFIISMLFQNSPADLKLQLIDPKGGLEFGAYENLPYLYGEIVDSDEKALCVLNEIIVEMESRYHLFRDCRVKKLSDYNELDGVDKKPYIVIVIDEFGDLVGMPKGNKVKDAVRRLAYKGRAAGIHLVIATQKPTAKLIDDIKSNLPARLAFRVATQNDSRVILDENGAENLYGYGDCLFKDPAVPELRRFQAAYVSDEEIENFVKILRAHWGV